MSAACYLVRLAKPIRRLVKESRVSQEWTYLMDDSYIHAFSNLAAAERFTRDHKPLKQNPFEGPAWIWNEEVHPNTYFRDAVDWGHAIRCITTLCTWITEAGMEPPGVEERNFPEVWPLWWELVTDGMNEWECFRLRYQLALPPWTAGLSDVRWVGNDDCSWITGDGTIRFPWVEPFSLSEWLALLETLSLTPDSMPKDTLAWRNWWSAKVTRLDEETQKFLWWALVPFPYEIVEVPLEGRR